jgi:hypothetical protein
MVRIFFGLLVLAALGAATLALAAGFVVIQQCFSVFGFWLTVGGPVAFFATAYFIGRAVE